MLFTSALGPWWVSLKSNIQEMGLLGRLPLYSLASGIVILAGLAREIVVASAYGLSGDLDVLVAVMGFHLLFGVQVGNALETVFVSKMSSRPGRYVTPLIMRVSCVFLLTNVVALTVLVLLSRPVLTVIFPEFSVEQYDTGIRLIQLLLFPIVCAGLAGLMRGGLSVKGSFTPVFLSGTVVSISTIISVVAFADRWGIDAMVCGFAAGHFLILVWFMAALGRGGLPLSKIDMPHQRIWIREMWRPVLIVLIGEFLFQAIVMTERSFASGLGTGKIAAFYYAGAVVAAPLALFSMPVNTTLFPKLARAFHTGYCEGRALLGRYGVLLFGTAILCSGILTLAAEPLINIALVRGKFSTSDAQTTAHILSVLVWGLPFSSLYGIVRNSFYSLSDYRTPLTGYGIKWLALVLCATWLVPSLGVDGLALSSVAAQAADTGVMGWLLRRRLAVESEGS